MFHLDNKTLSYGRTPVLREVTLSIGEGEIVSLLGRSGAGKSTLLKSLFEQRASEVALVPQDTALVQTLNVFHNVYMGRLHAYSTLYNLRNLVWPAQAQIQAMRPLLERLGLAEKLKNTVGELSGGQRQRVAVARAVHQGRAALLGDEPVSAVDDRQARDVLALISENYATVIWAMHDVDLALAFSDRIIGLADGRIALDQPASELKADDLRFLYDESVSAPPRLHDTSNPDSASHPIALEHS